MAPHDADNDRSSRMPLDCHTQADGLARRKERLGIIVLLLSAAWIGTSLVLSDQGDFHASRGPVAAVHQMWDTQCNACHVPFTPISSDSWEAPFLGDSHASSQRCQTCHEGAVHHGQQHPQFACGSCHREHRGREASLVNLPDRDCTQCHRDLAKHHSGIATFQNEVTRFDNNFHPEFRSIKTDPGKLKFNHALHLKAGMPVGAGGGATMTLGKIPESFRKRYQDQQAVKDDSAPVQLTCASCHQLDAGDFGVTPQQAGEFPFTLMGKRNAGAYMLPIAYENQCQACHPLTIERKTPNEPKSGYLTIPHRLHPDEIHEFLENHFTAQIARGQTGFLEKKVTRPLPGKTPDMLEPIVRARIEQKVEQAEKDLYFSKRLCAECHYFETGKTSRPHDLRVVPTEVPTVWLQHAKFNHTAHRAVQCAECHSGADRSVSQADVLIPDRDSCMECHAPKTKTGAPGARHNCTECHLYHNGDHAKQGVGASKRTPEKRRALDEFLSGK